MLSTVGSPTSADLADKIFREVAGLHTIDFGQCGDVLKFIMEPTPEREYAEFHDLYFRVYSMVSDIVDSNWLWLPARPRWTYLKVDHILLVEKRSLIHEAPFNHLSSIFGLFLHGFRVHDDNPVLTTTSMNFQLPSTFAIPDMAIQMTTATENHWSHEVIVIGECAFAQDTDSVRRKIKHEIAGHPNVLMVILVVIDEHQPYRSPERMSEAWQMLCQETSPRSVSSFHSLQGSTIRSPDQPIVIAGHTWCHLASVRFHVWVRGNEPINIDVDNSELQACGTLFPNRDMGAADTMIEKGMVMMRDCIATVCQEAAPGSYITAIQDSVVAFRPNWNDLLVGLKLGVWDTAYHRYRSWYDSPP
ncbi:hypothetical protein EV702DRAFT_1246814 [Suillus placidus]|uniref:Uncharacterized protein n=1 Tax=Suillus placidus TaxID=48579 RepID=A0A9P7CZN3_9AGAM|nr:hypothetical protein EV702DRAFT_1246814 [Suillus placidus]